MKKLDRVLREIRSTPWQIYEFRFHSRRVSIEPRGATVHPRRHETPLLERAGYDVNGHRPLFGMREVKCEIRYLERVARDPKALAKLPRRRVRPLGTRGRLPSTAKLLARMRRSKWRLGWFGLSRLGTDRLAACVVQLDRFEPFIEMHVQLFTNRANDRTFDRERRRIARALTPCGYRPARTHRFRNGHRIWIMDKRVPSIIAARRERELLDRILFGSARVEKARRKSRDTNLRFGGH